MYGRAFTLEDEDEDGIISYEVFPKIPTLTLKKKQGDYFIEGSIMLETVVAVQFLVPNISFTKTAQNYLRYILFSKER